MLSKYLSYIQNKGLFKNLQYNDTSYKFSSYVQSRYNNTAAIPVKMKPVIEITVEGMSYSLSSLWYNALIENIDTVLNMLVVQNSIFM